jgi:Ca-activated chloride channel homolog
VVDIHSSLDRLAHARVSFRYWLSLMLAIRFAAVWPLGLLAALPVVWLFAWRSRTPLIRRHMAVAALLRTLALAMVAVALTGPTLHIGIHDISVVYALDISRSVSPEFVRSALEWIRQVNATYRPAQARYVVFADRARLVDSLDDIPAVTVAVEEVNATNTDASDPAGAIDQGATDLEQALVTSVYGFAPGHAKRLVFLSDGNQTEGNLWRALPRLQADHVRVFAVPASVAISNDAWIEALLAPDDVRQKEPVTIKVRVSSRSQTPARVQIRSGGRILGTRFTALSPGENKFAFQVRFPVAGENSVTVQVFAEGDQVKQNDTLTQSIWVRPRTKVLYVESATASAHYLADALTEQGIEVTVSTVNQFAREPKLLDGKDAVVLSDVPADGITEATSKRMENFVRDQGRGLIFVAGENTYGKQGFAKSALERLLPVKFEGRRKRKDLDIVLLIDRSFSMRGHKMELAKSAALATLDLLDEQHRLAVVAFDSKAHDVVPLAEVGSKRRAEELIGSMSASGQTSIYAALLHAHRVLKDSHAKSKHIILLSDGDTAPPPGTVTARSSNEEATEMMRKLREDTIRRENGVVEVPEPAIVAQGDFPQIAAELVEAKVTLSTVAIGDKPNLELMEGLARWGHGRSYVAKTDSEIPGMFVAETRRLLGESIVEESFRPIVRGRSEMLLGVDFAGGPMLKGFVVAKPKKFSDVLLDAKDGQPLLAETYYGLGKTVAFLSDVKNRWAAHWLSWPGYGQMWAQVVRASVRHDGDGQLGWRVVREGREAIITLKASNPDGTYRNLAPKVRVITPEAQSTVVVLRQVASGKYRAHVPLAASRNAPFRFELIPSLGVSAQELARVGTRSLFYSYSDEYRVLQPNLPFLKALSESTGGKLAPKASEIFADLGDGGDVSKALWQYFAAAALILFLLDIFVRRAPWLLKLGR